MKIWVTKYCLTEGIIKHEGRPTNIPNMVEYGENQYAHGEGKDWHRTFESAQSRAESMRVKKIASMRSSIAKLEAMRFDA